MTLISIPGRVVPPDHPDRLANVEHDRDTSPTAFHIGTTSLGTSCLLPGLPDSGNLGISESIRALTHQRGALQRHRRPHGYELLAVAMVIKTTKP
jgi:hypothetical protein